MKIKTGLVQLGLILGIGIGGAFAMPPGPRPGSHAALNPPSATPPSENSQEAQGGATSQSAPCGPASEVFDFLRNDLHQTVFWWGKTPGDLTFVLTEGVATLKESKKINVWTLVVINHGVACIAGTGFRLSNTDPT